MRIALIVLASLAPLALAQSSAPQGRTAGGALTKPCTQSRPAALCAMFAEEKPRNDEPLQAILARVPAKARTKPNPLDKDPLAPAAGKKLFGEHCAECHGDSAEGSKRGPSLSNGIAEDGTPGEIFWIVTNGVVRRGMPAWSKLPEPQRWQIVAFLKSLRAN